MISKNLYKFTLVGSMRQFVTQFTTLNAFQNSILLRIQSTNISAGQEWEKKLRIKKPFKCMTFTFKRHHQPISSIFNVEKRFDFFFVTSIKHLFQLKVFYSRVTQFSMSMSLPVHKFATGIAYLSQSNWIVHCFLLFTEWFVKISMFFRSDFTWRRFNCMLSLLFLL